MFEKDNISEHNCVIGVSECGEAFLIESEPSLIKDEYGFELFDGCFLDDNLTAHKDTPKESGIYKCKILVKWINAATESEPMDFEAFIWLSDVIKIEI